ncbi:sulfite exporter TauE/SafE family protein [Allomeiothermus silvanus]|uniref:sulfite exporter TauE/SafE family protein n=1 Tax=Allomeiothermus silvanus TaxID=52022 RepID=UPI0023F1F491|nr:sulfite exporter TauE/SafE family protein [Allomeiothermus silvanus]
MHLLFSALIGLSAGLLSGLFGIGGGVIVVPALIFLLGLDQRTATGTSLAALLLPVGILGVLAYAREGAVRWPVAALIALGLLLGTFFGARLAWQLPEGALRVGLALLLIGVALHLLLRR